ncbi:MAG: DivIVA domain-containing protein [Lachnospiraceae bacterium]|nr:DivIVA domain-containing protein [Ruminococcus sp.]MCM1274696.1 DivIVA domain-containing protein [Lachnospiraceae bacterium]
MNAKEIVTKKFEKAAFNGYKPDDVDEYLREVSEEFAQLQKDKSELERKLEVLADKIREYRDDEDALRDALLVAQKQGNAIVAESKASAEKLTKETNETVTKQLADAKTKSERLVNDADEYSKKTRADADAAGAKIISDANNKAAEIKAAMDRQQEIQENILQQTRKEVLEYRTKMLAGYKEHLAVIEASYKEHMGLIESLPEKCENDYIKRTAEEVEKREAERKKQAAQAAAAKAAQQKNKPSPKPAPKPAEKPADKSKDKKEEPAKEESKVSDKTAEHDLPFFNSSSETVSRHDNLKFGKNNNK